MQNAVKDSVPHFCGALCTSAGPAWTVQVHGTTYTSLGRHSEGSHYASVHCRCIEWDCPSRFAVAHTGAVMTAGCLTDSDESKKYRIEYTMLYNWFYRVAQEKEIHFWIYH